MSLVLDGSVALACCFSDETTPVIDEVMPGAARDGAVVPSIWWLEVANGLRSGIRRGRLTASARNDLLAAFTDMRIDADIDTDRQAWTTTLILADRHRLTSYDASCLDLACRRGLPLASLDRALRAAAEAENVPLPGT